MLQDSVMQPCRLTRPNVGRRPAGRRSARQGETMLPSVSLPMAKPTSPAATAEAEPADEPLEPCFGVPRIAGHAAEPLVAHGQCAERQLGDQHRAGLLQPPGDGGLLVEHLVLERRRAPGRRVAGIGDQVLRPPGDAVQRAAILPAAISPSACAACFSASSSVSVTTHLSSGSNRLSRPR